MELFQYSTNSNERLIINPTQIVALRGVIHDDQTARLEIHTASSTLVISKYFKDEEEMKDEMSRVQEELQKL